MVPSQHGTSAPEVKLQLFTSLVRPILRCMWTIFGTQMPRIRDSSFSTYIRTQRSRDRSTILLLTPCRQLLVLHLVEAWATTGRQRVQIYSIILLNTRYVRTLHHITPNLVLYASRTALAVSNKSPPYALPYFMCDKPFR